jgi:tetratricopeptide (TPR) repeat protein
MAMQVFRSLWLGVALAPAAIAGWPGAGSAAAQTAAVPAEIDRLRQQALEEAEAGKTDDAIRDYRRALELQPDWKEGLWNLGMLQYGANRFPEAKAAFQKAVQFAPGLGMAWGLLGLSEYETGDYDDALAHLEKAQSIGIKDDDEVARVSNYHLGVLLVRAGEFDRASTLLLTNFGTGAVSPQAKIALGLAELRVPLLPERLDPSREALVLAAGEAAIAGSEEPSRLASLLKSHPDIPYLRSAYGRALAKAGRPKDALEQFRAETRFSPDSPLAWIELSREALREGFAVEALKAAQRAVQLAPQDREAHEALARAFESAGKKDLALAERRLEASATASPRVPEPRILRLYANVAGPQADQERWTQALREYMAGQYPAASADLKAWLAATPESGTGWALLGICEFALKDYDNALIHLDRSAKLGMSASPESLHLARYTYGTLLVHAGQFEQATEVLATAADATGPLATQIQYAMGLALLQRAQFPGDDEAHREPIVAEAGRIAALLQRSKYDEAIPQFKLLLDRYPDAPFLHYAYGTALISLSRFDEAAAEMQAELRISPKSELPCVRLASIALRQREAAMAATWAQRALDLAPSSVEAHYLLGRASLEAGDAVAAVRELEISSKLSPASPEVHFNLAKAYARARMPEKAQAEREVFSRLSQAAESQPDRHPADAPHVQREP